jgi:hypothetical protein
MYNLLYVISKEFLHAVLYLTPTRVVSSLGYNKLPVG